MRHYLILFFLLVFLHEINAQTFGCTDPLANNYNSVALINDGSCTYAITTVNPVFSYVLSDTLNETSGLVKWADYLWTHNDDTDTHIYAIDTTNGQIMNAYLLPSVINKDWEEISQDSTYFYIGDFGNNANGNRTDLLILRIEKLSLINGNPIIDSIQFSYETQINLSPTGANNTNFDCEAFIVWQDSIYLFTKEWLSLKTSIFVVPKLPGSYTAQLKAELNVQGLITGATFKEDKQLIVLCGYSTTLQPFIYLLYDFPQTHFFSGNKRKIGLNLSFHQVEGIATENGLKYYITNEYFSHPPYATNFQKLHILDLSAYLSNYLNGTHVGCVTSEMRDELSLYPNPVNDLLHIYADREAEMCQNFVIYDINGYVVKTFIMGKSISLDVSFLKSGSYFIKPIDKQLPILKFIKD